MKTIFRFSVIILACYVLVSSRMPVTFMDYIENSDFSLNQFGESISQLFKRNSGETNSSSTFKVDYHRYDQETNEYFNEIALKSEFNTSIKKTPSRWTTDMKIYYFGYCPEYMTDELRHILTELNDLIDPIQISIVSKRSDANFIIYLGSQNGFKQNFPDINAKLLERNWGLFQTYSNGGEMYVDMIRTKEDLEAQKHLLREELTQSLGLCNDSWKYDNSIFYQGWTTTTEFSEMDKRLIDLLYN